MSALSLYRSAIQFGINLLVVAFVAPSAYGLVAFTTPFIIFISMMTDMGLSSAIIRNPDLTPRQIGAAFLFTVLIGCVFAALLMLAAWPLEHLILMHGLSGVMVGMSCSLILMIAGSVPRALLERELRYGAVASVEAFSVFVGAVCAVIMVVGGTGIWSLVGYNIIANLLRFLLLLHFCRGQVRPNREFGGLRPLFSFGIWVFATNTLNFFARNGDNLLIGAFLGSAAVGLYGLSYQFMVLPLMAISWPVSGVLLATLSQEGLESPRSSALIEGVVGLTALFSFPAMIYLTFGFAYPAEAFFSEKWAGVADIMMWLAPVGAVQSIAAYNGTVLLVAGKAKAQFWYSVLNSIAIVITFVLALPFGLKAMVKAYAVVAILLSLGFLGLIVWLSNVTWRGLVFALAPAIVATAGAVAAALMVRWGGDAAIARWLLQTVLYVAVVTAVYAAFRRRISGFISVTKRGQAEAVVGAGEAQPASSLVS